MNERLARLIAWHLPRRIVYWAAIRLAANATAGEWHTQVVPDLTFIDALERWDA